MKTSSEAELVYLVENWLVRQGYETRLELQWRPLARTDLVGRRDDEYVAVEVKTRDWNKALEQALCQGKAFETVYIAAEYSPNSTSLEAILSDTCAWTNWVGVLGIVGGQVIVLREGRPKPGRSCQIHRAAVALQFLGSTREGQEPYRAPRRSLPAAAYVH